MNKKNIIILASVSCILSLSSCHFNRTYLDEKSEKEKAEKVTTNLYNHLQKKEFNDVENLFSERFFKITNRAEALKIFTKTQKILGDYKSKKLVDWKTKRVEGSNPSSEFLLLYEVQYEHNKSKEAIDLVTENGIIKIIGYNVNSDGFLK